MLKTSHFSGFRRHLVRKWRHWIVIALLLIFPLFFICGPGYFSPRSLKEVWNLGHFFFFALLVLVLDSHWCSTGRSIYFRIFAVFLTLVCVGLGIELIQLNIAGRFFSWNDVGRDLLGGAVALLWKTGRKLPRIQSALIGMVSTFIVLFQFVPLGIVLADEYRSYRDFPLLSGFENGAELNRWSADRVERSLVTSPRVQGRYSVKISLTTEKYSGLSLRHFPNDWSGWSALAFNVFNPGQPIFLHYRIHDYQHQSKMQIYTDRFNGRTALEHGWNEIIIPLTDIIEAPEHREIDVTKICDFGLFVTKQTEQRVLFLDNVRLL